MSCWGNGHPSIYTNFKTLVNSNTGYGPNTKRNRPWNSPDRLFKTASKLSFVIFWWTFHICFVYISIIYTWDPLKGLIYKGMVINRKSGLYEYVCENRIWMGISDNLCLSLHLEPNWSGGQTGKTLWVRTRDILKKSNEFWYPPIWI